MVVRNCLLVAAIALSSTCSFVASFSSLTSTGAFLFLPSERVARRNEFGPTKGFGGLGIRTTRRSSSIMNRDRCKLAAKSKNSWDDEKNLREFCAEQESRAIAASESWIVEATGFLEPEPSSALVATLEGRADVVCLCVGAYRGMTASRRARCVFANPDLGYDQGTADSDYVSYLKIDNLSLSQCDPWPNILVNIGLSLEAVGDVLLVPNESLAYLTVTPESEKTCTRLLPKELPGTGVTVTKLSKEEMDAEMATISDSDAEVVQDMQVQRVDKRK